MDNYHCDSRDSEPEARWANQFNTGYRSCVIELVFYQNSGKDKKERVLTRIISSPEDAKDFLENLKETIDKYEKEYGPICVEDKDKHKHIE